MLFSAIAGLQLLALAAAKCIEIQVDQITYYLQASDGRYILTDDINKAYGDFSVENGRIHGVGELGATRDNRVLDGAFYSLDVTKSGGFYRGDFLFLADKHYSWYVCQDPVTSSGDWLLYIYDDRFSFSDYLHATDIISIDDGSTILDVETDISSPVGILDTSSVKGDSSTVIEDTTLSVPGTFRGASTISEDTPPAVGDTSTVVAGDTVIVDTSTPILDTSTPIVDTNTPGGEVRESSTAPEQIPGNPDTVQGVETSAAEVPTPIADVTLSIETALRRLLKEREDLFYPVDYNQCIAVYLLLVDKPDCLGTACETPTCTTQCLQSSCTGDPCYHKICVTNCPGQSCSTECSQSLCAKGASCPPDICNTKCPEKCLTICPTVTCIGGCPPPKCTTQCVGKCDLICPVTCTDSNCGGCTTSCPSDCSGTSCPCTGPLCPGGVDGGTCTGTSCPGKVDGGTCTGPSCPGKVDGSTCTGLACKACTTCDKTVIYRGCPSCVYTFTDYVFTCPSLTTIVISTCTKTSVCSPKTVTFSPGTHTVSGTCVVPVKTDISLTIKAAAASGSGAKTTGSAGSSGGSGSSGSTTGASGGSAKSLMGTLIGAIGLFMLLW